MMLRSALALAISLTAVAASAQVQSLDDVSFVVPDGWKVEPTADYVSVGSANGENYLLFLVFKQQPSSGDAEADFKTAWAQLLTATLKEALPSPIYDLRAKAGYPGKFGGARSNDSTKFFQLQILEAGKAFVPVVVVAPNSFVVNDSWLAVSTFMQSIRVAPARAQPPKKQIAVADLAGEWRTGASSTQTYVNASTGAYAGSNTVAYGISYSIAPGGAYTSSFQGLSGGHVVREQGAGVVEITPELIVVRPKTNSPMKYRIISCMVAVNGGTILTLLSEQYPVTSPNVNLYAEDWVREPPKK